jgi:hypothetical protein
MKKKILAAIGIAFLALIPAVAYVQSVPQLINYQGRLADSSGQPVDGSREMRFRLLDADTLSASVLWSETHSSVQVDKGIYHVILGSVNPLPPSALSSSAIFLEVRVQGEILRPRSLLTSVPFAHKAELANTASHVSPGSVTAESIGEDCAVGEVLAKTALGWQCQPLWGIYTWFWMSGSDVIDQNGFYGTKGTPDPANVPGSRRYAVSWKDSSGNFWLFGGQGYPASGSAGWLNDLWRWYGNYWTWMSGSDGSNQNGVYGTKGTPAPGNVPGARGNRAVSWSDDSGNLWLFGGYGYPASGSAGWLNDLWRWDGTDWTWMSGSNVINQNGVYGTKGTPDPANVPGARYGAVSWTDVSGNFWLFGGEGYAASSGGRLNDLWRWDGTDWTWMSGSDGINQNGVYGTKGIPDPGNVPGSRKFAVSWTDSSGNLWLFGGYGYPASGSSYDHLNDLWRWDGSDWTWMSGSDVTNQNGVYGTKRTPDPANVPGSRYTSVSWIDDSGNLWLFGGDGYDASGSLGMLNDLWKWDGSDWTWMSGSDVINQNGVYGTKGTPDSANVPGARYGAVSWTDSSGNLWLLGGYGYPASGELGNLNDLWKYTN